MNFLNKLFIIFFSINMMYLPAFAVLDIDTSVDDAIRKKYNPDRLENDVLPPLPEKLKNDKPLKSNEDFTQSSQQKQQTSINPVPNNLSGKNNSLKEIKTLGLGHTINLRKGSKFNVRSTSRLTNNLQSGTKVYFKLDNTVKIKQTTFPSGTRFIGVVVDSHPPQITGNGGLLVIRVEKIIINGKSYIFDGKVTEVNHRNIYFNNIKGKRKYWCNVSASIQPGKRFYNKTWRTTKTLAGSNITLIFSPFTFVTGAVALGANVIVSPVVSLFSKGGSLTIPADTAFEIKLLKNTVMY